MAAYCAIGFVVAIFLSIVTYSLCATTARADAAMDEYEAQHDKN
jgi:hypothetical protein